MPWRRERGPLRPACLEHRLQRSLAGCPAKGAESDTTEAAKQRASRGTCVLPLGNSEGPLSFTLSMTRKGPLSFTLSRDPKAGYEERLCWSFTLRPGRPLQRRAGPLSTAPAWASPPATPPHSGLGRPRSGSPREGKQEAFSL